MKRRIEIKKEESLDVDFLIEVLVEYGFARVDFVYEPGQFSIRGGIVDIFSYGNEWPYRVELFDEEVESIRTFDPITQLSQQNIAKVSIVPNINTKFSQSQKVSLFQVLPQNTVLWVKDFQVLLDKLQICFEKAEEFAKTVSATDETELAELFKERAFILPSEVINDVQQYSILSLSRGIQAIPISRKVTFAVRPQPSFNKNFKLLIENLHDNATNGIENYLFTEKPSTDRTLLCYF